MTNKSLTIKRETVDVFSVTSNFPFWSGNGDGRINSRVAFNTSGVLSSMRAQSIDAKNGNRYILIAPFSVKNPAALLAAKSLGVGESQTVAVS